MAVPAIAGPPFLTDDPVPTETGHWEIYGFSAAEGRAADLDDDLGLDLNYGAAKDIQLTATVPLSVSYEALGGWRAGAGDLELGAKYRFVNKQKSGFSAAIFPRTILPTASRSSGEKTRLLLPVWLEQDLSGGTSVFGGGGFEYNPGTGNRNFWQAALAVTQNLGKTLSIGGEAAWQQPDTPGATDQLRAGAGGIVKLSGHYSLLVSGGPTWADHHRGYHVYAALGADF